MKERVQTKCHPPRLIAQPMLDNTIRLHPHCFTDVFYTIVSFSFPSFPVLEVDGYGRWTREPVNLVCLRSLYVNESICNLPFLEIIPQLTAQQRKLTRSPSSTRSACTAPRGGFYVAFISSSPSSPCLVSFPSPVAETNTDGISAGGTEKRIKIHILRC